MKLKLAAHAAELTHQFVKATDMPASGNGLELGIVTFVLPDKRQLPLVRQSLGRNGSGSFAKAAQDCPVSAV